MLNCFCCKSEDITPTKNTQIDKDEGRITNLSSQSKVIPEKSQLNDNGDVKLAYIKSPDTTQNSKVEMDTNQPVVEIEFVHLVHESGDHVDCKNTEVSTLIEDARLIEKVDEINHISRFIQSVLL